MMQLKENQPDFEIVDGPGKGMKFQQGTIYVKQDIPKMYMKRFQAVKRSATERKVKK